MDGYGWPRMIAVHTPDGSRPMECKAWPPFSTKLDPHRLVSRSMVLFFFESDIFDCPQHA